MQRQHLLLASTVILGLARITALPNSCLTPSDKLEAPDYCLEHQPHFACESEEVSKMGLYFIGLEISFI